MTAETRKDFNRMVGERIKAARESIALNQKELSERLGFKDRQTLSAIENGTRKVSTAELLSLMKLLLRDLEYFTDPFRLVGEGAFSWRAQVEPEILNAFEEKAGGWIAMYRALRAELGELFNPLVAQLGLSERSSYEDAWDAADRLHQNWNLGETPATTLPGIAEERLDILVLFVDVRGGVSISGAACHLPEFNTILINRREPDGRRAFDFAHELFHILTWQNMQPEWVDTDSPSKTKAKRVEQLANNFAAALLMPRRVVEDRWKGRDASEDIHDWVNRTADGFGVTARALYFWLRNLELLSTRDRLSIVENRLIWNGRTPEENNLPNLYSRKFMEAIKKALAKGNISERRAASILDMSTDGLRNLLGGYHLLEVEEGPVTENDPAR
ncbi:MAG: XRE family transcriptional regulator [Thermoleophilia bacterium]